ncbi:MAG: adenylosuccinate lyase [Fimbriimonadales bacterium]|nr:adenylosuccinate lyase [Fimbriimonadales bacterium]
MIDRYCTPAMNAIWSRQAKYQRWQDVEIAICEGWAEVGVVPAGDLSEIQSVTSYDVIDTASAMMLRDSCSVLLESAGKLRETILGLAQEHMGTPCIGRTHGIHAEPVTFGFKCSNWLAELDRNIVRIRECKRDLSFGKISGAVGIHAVVDPAMEVSVLKRLGLEQEPASTQIVNRDKHANFLNTLALLGAGLERIATELRNLQRTEILEVQEAFAAGQTGSSAMPHKRNPWNSETVCGLARLLRGNAMAMLESVATWHERDLTNSSLERVIFPDSCQLADFMLNRMNRILSGLVVMPENMQTNLRKMGDLVFSEHLMVALVGKGLSRAAAYKVAQRNAAMAWDGHDFKSSVQEDETVKQHLSSEEIEHIFSLDHHLRNAQFTLDAVLKQF